MSGVPDLARIGAALDRALELDGPERASFLATLDPDVGEAVARGLADDSFLDAPEAARATLSLGAEAGEGVRLGPYVLESLVGEGGMGRVYRAHRADGAFEQTVAVKVVRQSLALAGTEVAARLRRERDLLAALDHPGIARLIDGGETDDGVPYLVTEFVDGAPITLWAAARGLGVRERVRLVADVARAVDHAHRRFVLHRDLKPGNVLVTERDGPGGTPEARPVVLDFGIAKLLDEAEAPAGAFPLTRTGLRLLTPAYAAPELFDPTLDVTVAADIYGLGALLYELLTGRRPGDTATRPATGPTRPSRLVAAPEASGGGGASGEGDASHAEACGPASGGSASGVRTGIPARALRGDLDVISLRALHADPSRRYASAADFADDLDRYLDGRPVEARSDSLAYVIGRFARRHRVAVAAGIVALVALFGGLGTSVVALGEARAEATRATEASNLLGGLLGLGNVAAVDGRVPTARDLLDSALVRSEQIESDELRAYLLSTLARAFDSNEDPVRADSLLRRMLAAVETLDVEPALRAEVRYQYAVAHTDVGGTEAGLGIMRRARDEAEPGTELHVRATNGLSWLLRSHGEEEEGLRHAQTALRLARELPPGQAAGAAAAAYSQIGWSLSGLDRWEEAVEAFEDGWGIQRERFGDESLQSAEAAQSLGAHYEKVGRIRDAGRARRLVLRVFRRALGPSHHLVAAAQGSMADQLRLEGDLVGAEAMNDSASVNLLKAWGVGRWFVPQRFTTLAEVRHELGAYPEAEAAARQAIEIHIAKGDTLSDSYPLGNAYVVLGRALHAQGREGDAGGAFRRSLRHLVGERASASQAELAGALRGEAQRYLAGGR